MVGDNILEKGILQPAESIFYIQPGDLLVSEGYVFDREAAIQYAILQIYPGYPPLEKRITMNPEQYQAWINAGRSRDALVRRDPNTGQPTNVVADHPNYRRGVELGRASRRDGITDDLRRLKYVSTVHPSGEYPRDSLGAPIHPDAELILKHGAIIGTGFYWGEGPQIARDPVVFRIAKEEIEGKMQEVLQVLLIVRKETGDHALPGGMADPNEPDISTATRELMEEAGVDLTDVPHELVLTDVVYDPRATLNAWPETSVFLLRPTPEVSQKMKLKAGDDAREAMWVTVSEKHLDSLFASHAHFVKMSVLAWQRDEGQVVDKSGRIGIRA